MWRKCGVAFGGRHMSVTHFLWLGECSQIRNCCRPVVRRAVHGAPRNQGERELWFSQGLYLSVPCNSLPHRQKSLIPLLKGYIGAPALLQYNACHNCNRTIYYVINGLILIFLARGRSMRTRFSRATSWVNNPHSHTGSCAEKEPTLG